jgi:ribosomal-protein-alanine acetyltransferase
MNSTGDSSRAATGHLIRRMSSKDAAHAATILKESPEASPWSVRDILEFAGIGMGWVAELEGRVCGFLIGRAVADEFEILNMAVEQAHRRRGIANQLVKVAIEWSGSAGARTAHLEVRASNSAALSLYGRNGFVPSGRRARYYQNPVEDAILLTRP